MCRQRTSLDESAQAAGSHEFASKNGNRRANPTWSTIASIRMLREVPLIAPRTKPCRLLFLEHGVPVAPSLLIEAKADAATNLD